VRGRFLPRFQLLSARWSRVQLIKSTMQQQFMHGQVHNAIRKNVGFLQKGHTGGDARHFAAIEISGVCVMMCSCSLSNAVHTFFRRKKPFSKRKSALMKAAILEQ